MSLRLVPLGGLGEIGMNCLALEQEGGILVVDCGISFPHDDLGADTQHARFDWLLERRRDVVGVVLTHGHEDHVGALPYLLAELPVPVYGPPHALAVARHRLAEAGLDMGRLRLVPTTPRTRFTVGPFGVEPIRVTHSIADATALAIDTAAGLVVHTGDFKLDPRPPDGQLTDEARLRELGDRGVRLLMSDSTNIDARGEPGSESDVAEALEPILRKARGRVVVGLFASNVQRLRVLGDIARRTRRKIALMGRSMQSHVEWARDLERLDWPSDLLVPVHEARDLPPDQLLVLAGGTQAEPNSALARMAQGSHPQLLLEPGDTVVLSSRVIPGNDVPVYAMMGDLIRRGIELRTWISDPGVHVSGHAHRSEQRRMIEWTRPRAFLPVHGTLHHLMRHAELAREVGVREVLAVENGQTVVVDDRGLTAGERVAVGRVATWGGRTVPEAALRERQSIARAGVVHVTLVVDKKGALVAPPAIAARGLFDAEGADEALRKVALEVQQSVDRGRAPRERVWDATLEDAARLAARRAVERFTGKKPVAVVTVVRL